LFDESSLSRKRQSSATPINPTLSKILRGRMESVTIDRLASWLTALGRTVEIRVRPYNAKKKTGQLVAIP